jgi:dTDP-4-dehydrorhamnose reductase
VNERRRVLITGAAGLVGQVLARAWRHRYDLTLTDIRPMEPTSWARFLPADLCQVGIERTLCAGIDTVVHLAISGNLRDPRDQLLPVNLDATPRLMEAAAEAGCRRLIVTSSLSIALYPETDYAQAKLETEADARALAQSSALSIHCLRLGWVVASTNPALWPGCRDIDYALTHGDLVRLFTASIESPSSVHFGIFDGISDNGQASVLANLAPTRRILHYEPLDNAHALARRKLYTLRGIVRLLKQWVKKLCCKQLQRK